MECWNFSTSKRFDLPTGLSFELEHATDTSYYIICIRAKNKEKDRLGNRIEDGIELTYEDKFTHKICNQRGYRFIVKTEVLNDAAGLDLPLETFDMVSAIMEYEQGDMDNDKAIALFQRLVDDGTAWQLQGHYGRTAENLIKYGLVTPAANAVLL